jgi:carboxyl-terminal processing protease
VVLDLRGNGGGILQEAVKIVNLFVPKGTLIVSQKGKVKTNNAEYFANASPVDTEIPLAILVDNGSASASEIVAGAIQDTDRGIIIGERTYGKGLVQQTLSLSYNSLMKVTIAKYYTPSGRCIQSLDYTHRKDDGSVVKVADSLITEFKTKNKRSIYDGSGIYPDITTTSPAFHLVSFELMQKYLVFNYATEFRAKNNTIPSAKTFELNEQQYNEFVSFVEQAKFDYKTKSEEQLAELEKVSKKEKYYANVSADYEKLKAKIVAKKKTDLITFKSEIKQLIESEIACRYYYQDGRVEASFKYDDDIKEALKILQTPTTYLAIVNGEGKYKVIGKPVKEITEPTAQKEEDADGNDE